jgi:HK97 family phage major capsid protein
LNLSQLRQRANELDRDADQDPYRSYNKTAVLSAKNEKVEQFRALVEACETRGSVSADDQAKLDSISTEIRRFDEIIAGIDARQPGSTTARSGGDVLTREASFADWYEARHGGYGVGGDGLSFGDARDFSLGRVIAAKAGRLDHRSLSDLEARALNEGSDAAGGFMVPEFLSTKIIDRVRNAAQVMKAGAVTVPMDSDTLHMARLVGGSTAEWKAESAPVSESDQTYERITLKTKTAVVLQRLSQELFEDLSPEGLKVVENEIAQALALKLDFAALIGNPDADAESPRGILYQSGVNMVDMGAAAGATPTDFDFLIDAVAAIRDANGTASAAIMASRTLTTLDKLKDTTGQPLRQPEAVANLTKYVSNTVPTDLTHGTATDASLAFVGGFENVLIGVRPQLGIRFKVLDQRYADNLQVGLIAWLRADVALAHPEHLSVVTGIKP